jgi:phospholipase C
MRSSRDPLAVFLVLAAFVVLAAPACTGGASGLPGPTPFPSASIGPASKIQHVIIIFQENRSPDNLFHGLPGADIANSGTNSLGQTVALQPVDVTAPYDIDHSHGAFTTEYNGGAMNGWNLVHFNCPSNACNPLTAFGYVPPSEVSQYFQMAEQYAFADRMFQTNQGPSFPAHQFIISGTSTNAAGSNLLASENPHYADTGHLNCDGSPSSFVAMIDPSGSEATTLVPCFEHQALSDLLDAHGLTWRYYAPAIGGLWNGPDAISHIRNGTDWSFVIVPQTNILTDIQGGTLASVSWVIPDGAESDHALGTNGSGPAWVASIVNAVGASPYWNSTAIFITWDDWGGWFDHVKPQILNSYELGFRVPLIVVSPYAKAGYVSHVQHEFGSVIRFVEDNWGLGTLGFTDSHSDDLADCFNYAQTPIAFKTISGAMRVPLASVQSGTSPDSDF